MAKFVAKMRTLIVSPFTFSLSNEVGRTTHNDFYVIDITRQQMMNISEGPKFICNFFDILFCWRVMIEMIFFLTQSHLTSILFLSVQQGSSKDKSPEACWMESYPHNAPKSRRCTVFFPRTNG